MQGEAVLRDSGKPGKSAFEKNQAKSVTSG